MIALPLIAAPTAAAAPAAGLAPAAAAPAAHPSADSGASCASKPFPDVATANIFCQDITWLKSQGITNGAADGNYGPTQAVSRQEMAAFLFRLQNPGWQDLTCSSAPFSDVDASGPFCGDINWLVQADVTNGTGPNTFSPTRAVSRQAMAAFLFRLHNPGQSPPSCSAKPFPDVATTNLFCGAIDWLHRQGITNGNTAGNFNPATRVSRQAMAAFLHRLAGSSPSPVKLDAGTWTVGGTAIAPGRYTASTAPGKSGTVEVDRAVGGPPVLETLGGSFGVPSVTITLRQGDVVTVNLTTSVTFTPAVLTLRRTLPTGIWLVGRDMMPGRYKVVPASGTHGKFTVERKGGGDDVAEVIGQDGYGVPSVTLTLRQGDVVEVRNNIPSVTLQSATIKLRTTLTTGIWQVGRDIAPGGYRATPPPSESGKLQVDRSSGGDDITQILGGTLGEPSITLTLRDGDVISISRLAKVMFAAA